VDVCTITGGDFNNFYNQSEGTIFAESLKTTGPASNSHICGPSNGSYNEFIDFRYFNDSLIQNVTNHLNVTQFSLARSYTLNAITRQAIAYALNNAAYCLQGGDVVVDVPPYTPPVVDRFQIGTAGQGTLMLNGCVLSIRYFKKRMPNAKLQTITQLVSDIDATAYIVSLLSAGATVTPTQQAAINTFFKAEKMAGRYELLKRIYLPIWGVAAANALCMKSLTSGTFVGNVTHGAGFVKSDGTTGYFDGGVSPAAAGCLLESSSIFCLSYELNKFIANTERFCGVQGANNLTRTWIERYGSGHGPNTATIVNSPVDNDNRYVFIRSRPNNTFRFNGRFRSVYETKGSVSDAAQGLESVQNVYYLGFNNNGTPNFPNVDAKLGSYGIGLGYTEIEAAGFTANLKTLWETCTGLTLP
jgi:hypothetical protein